MRFRITVFNERGGLSAVTLDAPSESAAVQQASAQGAAVISVHAERLSRIRIGRRRSRFALLGFSQELLALLRAGVGLVESIETLAEKEENDASRLVLEQVLQELRAGKPLSSALQAAAGVFPPLYVAAVRASERSGNLVESLSRFVRYRTQVEAAAKKALTALVYPVLLLGVGALVTLFLLAYVVPRFSRIFEDRMSDVPLLTQLLIAWGNALNAHPWLAGLGLAAALAAVALGVTRPGAKALALRVLARLPRIGARLRLLQLARMYRTLGMLLRSGIPIVQALGMARELMQGASLPAYDGACARIREGVPISLAFAGADLTTPVAARMLRVGEQTGNMGEMMENLADLFDEDNARALEILSRIFEPVLMALIGLVIGSIVVLMYLPIFDLASNIP